MKVFIKVQITHLCYDRYIDFVYRIMVLIFVWQNLLRFARQVQKYRGGVYGKLYH